MDEMTLATAIAIIEKRAGGAAARAETAKEEAEAAADRVIGLSQGVYMGVDGKFYIDIEE